MSKISDLILLHKIAKLYNKRRRSLDNFTNIGKAVLIQALGIQKNYTTIIENTVEVVDYSNPSCSSCKYKAIIENFDKDSDMYKTASTYCAYCPNKLLTTRNVTKSLP